MLDEDFNCLFHISRTLVLECLGTTANNTSAEPLEDLNDDPFTDHLVLKLAPFMDHIPAEE